MPWVNLYEHPIGPFCLIACHLYQLIPGGIANAFVHTTVIAVLHVFDSQVLEYDNLVVFYQPKTQFMDKIFPTILDTSMDMLNNPLVFAILACALLALGKSTLCFGEVLLFVAKKARVRDNVAIGKHGEVLQAKINSYHIGNGRKWLWFKVNHKTSVPIAKAISLDMQLLDLAFNRSVVDDLYVTDLGEPQSVILQEFESALRKGKRLVPSFAFESWIARIFAVLATPEKMLKGKINAGTNFLQCLRVGLFQPGIFSFPVGEHSHRIVSRDRLFPLFPRLFANLKRFVIYPTARVKNASHGRSLRFCGVESVLENLGCHIYIIPDLCRYCTT
jgi:hypothetical protein